MLGSSLPTALAAKVAYPDSRVIMLTGDGAFGFNGMEFDTAVRHKLNIVAILGNDSAWGIDRQIQLGLYGRPVATELLQTRQVSDPTYKTFVERFGERDVVDLVALMGGYHTTSMLFRVERYPLPPGQKEEIPRPM